MFESIVVCGRIALGIQGEHNARKVSFYDAEIWNEKLGQGRFELLHQRNGDESPYPVVVTMEGNVPCWYVSASDTAIAGSGKCELRYMVDDKLIKSCTYITDVVASLGDDTTEAPEPEKAWVDQVLEAGDTAKQAVELSEKAIEASEVAEQSAKDAEAFAKEAENFASEGGEHIADTSNPHEVTASQVGAYSKDEADELIKNPYIEEDINLTNITTAHPMFEDAYIGIDEKMLSSDGCAYDIDISGRLKFDCEVGSGETEIYINGARFVTLGDNYMHQFSFEGDVESMTVVCSMSAIEFSTFTKATFIKDIIGDIDSALDSILAIQESIVGGVE